MDKQDTLRNLLIAASVFLILMAIGPQLLPPPKPVVEKEPPAVPTASTSFGEESPAPSPSTQEAKATTGTWSVIEAEEEQILYLGAPEEAGRSIPHKQVPYRMRVRLSNVGAAVESVALTDHAATLKKPDRYQLLSLIERPGGEKLRSFMVEKLNVDGQDIPLRSRRWRITTHDRLQKDGQEIERAEFALDLQLDNAPALRLTRTFELPAQPIELGRHDLFTELAITNVSPKPHRVVAVCTSGLGIRPTDPRRDDRVLDFGILAPTGLVSAARNTFPSVSSAPRFNLPLFALTASTADQFLSWIAVGDTYFTCTMAPVEADRRSTGKYIVSASGVDLDEKASTTDDITVRLVTAEASLQPSASLRYMFAIYLGEKDGRAFRSQPDYAARNYYFQISQGFGWCTFSWLVELMIRLLNGLYAIIPDYGVAIIILVLLVRALLHPITKKGQVNMVRMQHRMQELQPKIEEIKRKYANDKVRMNQELMKLDIINPGAQLMTCLPMLIQMPIWVALYLSLSNNIDMRHQPFLFTWIRDLTAPDALIAFSSPVIVPLLGWHIAGFNLLPILLTVFTYTQQKLQPKPPQPASMTEQQRAQQEMMQRMIPIMSLMMLLIFYNAPSGLTLYVMASSLFGTIEQWWIRKHIRERQAAGTLHKPPRKNGDGMGAQLKKLKPGWFARLQKLAEEARKAQHTQRARPKR